MIYNSGIWIWVLLQGIKSRSEKMWLVRTLKFEWMNVLQNVFYWKRMANVLTRPSGRKRILISTFAVRMQLLHFCLWRRFYVLLAVECLWMIKLNKTIISVLVYADTIKASLYFQFCYPYLQTKNPMSERMHSRDELASERGNLWLCASGLHLRI